MTALERYQGSLSEETAVELEESIAQRRERRSKAHRDRVRRITDALE
ncbi:hypothetical protein HTG_11140 [Natrinema mahii]|nr:hypothetical protein HTG_11140 [Natrinema mahii]